MRERIENAEKCDDGNITTYKGYKVVFEPATECYGDYYFLEKDGKRIALKIDEKGQLELDFSGCILWCEKLHKYCNYEYQTCNEYKRSNIASKENVNGRYVYHCEHGISKYYSHDDMQKHVPEYCEKIRRFVAEQSA